MGIVVYKFQIRTFEHTHVHYPSSATASRGSVGAMVSYNIDSAIVEQQLSDEIHEWLFENTIGKYCIDGFYLIFQLEEDAVHFKLKWGVE